MVSIRIRTDPSGRNYMMRGSADVRICPNVGLLRVVFGSSGRSELSAFERPRRALRSTLPEAASAFRNVQNEFGRSTNEELVEAREFLENVLESSTQYSIIAKNLDRRS